MQGAQRTVRGFSQRHPRPRTCAQPTQPRLLEQRSRLTPIHSRPACCLRQGAPCVPVDRRGTLAALCSVCSVYLACVLIFDFRLCGIKRVEAELVAPPVHVNFQPLRALCFSLPLSTKSTLSPMKHRVVHGHAIIPPVLRGVQRRRPFPNLCEGSVAPGPMVQVHRYLFLLARACSAAGQRTSCASIT